MPYVMVDVEADGPIPGDYSMISFGAVIVEPGLERTFYGRLRPISERFVPEALAVSGHSRAETLEFDEPFKVMTKFADWLRANCRNRMMFVSDNNGFDWQFINYYFHHFLGTNPLRPQQHEPRLAIQGASQRRLRQLQTSPPHEAHAPSGRRCQRQRRSTARDEGHDGAEDRAGLKR